MTREKAINIVRNIYQTDAEKEALATLIPELAESEDERIRKKCIAIISNWIDENDRRDCLAYLEKQKEQTTNEEMLRTLRVEYEKGVADTIAKYEQKEQKPVEWSEDFDKEVENVHKRYPEVSYAKLTRIAYHFSKWANRYKDTEWSEEDIDKMVNKRARKSGTTKTEMQFYRQGIEDTLRSIRPS